MKRVIIYYRREKSLMAKWLEQASQRHEMYCHDLEVMSSNPGWVELEVLVLLSYRSYVNQN